MSVRIIFFLVSASWFSFSNAQNFDRAAFYSVITGQNIKEINAELITLEKTTEKPAFKGALLMKKSGLVTESREKLKLFKEGHEQLESAIAKDTTNTEYRFLRLLIQENAPKIVNYHSAIKKDASYLRENYKNLPVIVQKAIWNYSKSSKVLKPEDFKNAAYE